MRLIDADALKAELLGRIALPDWALEAVLHIIDNAPTVEYPEQIIIECDTEDEQKVLSALRNARLTICEEVENEQ